MAATRKEYPWPRPDVTTLFSVKEVLVLPVSPIKVAHPEPPGAMESIL
jgi:hypothetical protein